MKNVSHLIGVGVLFTFAAGLLVILLRDDSESNLAPLIAGCFNSSDQRSRIELSSDGRLEFIGGMVGFDVVRDKNGIAVLPSRRLDRDALGMMIASGNKPPLLIRVSKNYDRLEFLDSDETVDFHRVICSS